MTLLLDTSVFLWAISGTTEKLSTRAKRALEDESNALFLSTVSLWEIFLKVQSGKLELPLEAEFFRDHMSSLGVQRVVPVEARHIYQLHGLPDHHRDPFDRLLAAQAQSEEMILVTSDSLLRRYPIKTIW